MKRYILILLVLFISGCGPQYQTTRSYVKPDSAEGVACTFQCENSKLRCEQNEALKQQNCESNNRIARLEYEQCVEKKGKDKCFYNWEPFCRSNTSACQASYDQCYSTCGGEVITRTNCVAGCE